MSSIAARRWAIPLAAVLLAAALLSGQAVADARAAEGSIGPGDAVGRAGFAYLTGLRRFGALLLWDRLEPQYHEYYADLPTKGQTFLLPNLRLVLLLDPQFIQAHYMIQWVVAENGKTDEALRLAEQGTLDNPRSGLLHMSYAQMLYLRAKDVDAAAAQSDFTLRDDTVWADATEQWQAMMVVRDIYDRAGMPEKRDRALAIAHQLESDLGAAPGFRDPDEQF